MDRREVDRLVGEALARGLDPRQVLHEVTPAALACEPPMSMVDLAMVVRKACPPAPATAPAAAAAPGRARQLADPELEPTLTGQRYAWPAAGLTVTIEQLVPSRGSIWAEVAVDCDPDRHAGAPARLHGPINLNILATPQLAGLAAHLERRLPTGLWADVVETACRMAIEASRTPAAPTRLADAVAGTPRAKYAIDPLLVEDDPTLIFAPGGAGKSILALALAAALDGAQGVVPFRVVTPHRVAYLDWEWSAAPHRRRLASMLSPEQMAASKLLYHRMTGDLVSQAPAVQALIASEGITYLVIDSIGLACGGEPEKAAVALAFANVVRGLGIGSLWVGHVPKSGSGEEVYGSKFWTNSARSVWQVQPASESGAGRLQVALHQRKVNDGPPLEPISLILDFRGERLSITKTDIYGEPAFQGSLTNRGRVRNILAQGSASALEIAAASGVPPAAVRTELEALARQGRVVELSSGSWGLAEKTTYRPRRDLEDDPDEPIPFEFQ